MVGVAVGSMPARMADALQHSAGGPRVAVMPLQSRTLEGTTKGILDDLLVASVDELDSYVVVGMNDVNAMLGLEKMKDALGCNQT